MLSTWLEVLWLFCSIWAAWTWTNTKTIRNYTRLQDVVHARLTALVIGVSWNYTRLTDKNAKPSEVRAIAEVIFKITPGQGDHRLYQRIKA